jgi:hypothetical protein
MDAITSDRRANLRPLKSVYVGKIPAFAALRTLKAGKDRRAAIAPSVSRGSGAVILLMLLGLMSASSRCW